MHNAASGVEPAEVSRPFNSNTRARVRFCNNHRLNSVHAPIYFSKIERTINYDQVRSEQLEPVSFFCTIPLLKCRLIDWLIDNPINSIFSYQSINQSINHEKSI